jgi:UDP-2,4-diacetamido-2,4,6-trideoxy-beta-L-altropyranose hydrolase
MIRLRPADANDMRRVWEWSNEPGVRAVSFNSDPIPWITHEQWFTAKLADPAVLFLIAEDETGQPVGQLRFDFRVQIATISLSLAPEARGRGLGAELITQASGSVFASGRAMLIEAFIKPNNAGSIRAFEKAGYQPMGEVEIGGHMARKFVLRKHNEQ